jgi:hypothetical protein
LALIADQEKRKAQRDHTKNSKTTIKVSKQKVVLDAMGPSVDNDLSQFNTQSKQLIGK